MLASRFALLTISMGPLAYVLAGHALHGSFGAGGLLAGANSLGQGVAAPWQGRRLDRTDTRRTLIETMLVVGASLALLAVAVAHHAPLVLALPLAALAGVAVAGVPAGYRALIPIVVAPADVDLALTADASLGLAMWVIGPALVSIVVTVLSPTAAVVVMAGLAVVAAALTVTVAGAAATVPHGESVLRDRRIVPIACLALGMGLAFGGYDFGFAPLARHLGASAAAGGWLISLISLSSAGAGFVYGLRRPAAASTRLVAATLAVWAAGLMLYAVAPTLWAAIALAAVEGLPVGPLTAQMSLLVRDRLAPSRQGEGFSVVWSAMTIGAGIGSAIGGAVVGWIGIGGVFVLIPALTLGAGLAAPALAGGDREEPFGGTALP